MGPELDLKQASRETLLAVIAEQRGVIAEQQDTIAQMGKRVEGLEARLSGGGPEARMPGHTPAARCKKPAEQEKKPRKKRPHGFARPRMEPTRRVVHAPESCPECHTILPGGWVQRTREVIEIPAAPVEVTEHVFMARTCPLCRKRRLPREPLQGVAVGRQRLGVNLVSLIITLREEGRLPVRTIQWYLRTVHQLKLSVGAIVRTIHQAAQQAGPAVNEVLERIRRSPVVHADETGWRENGVNGYVWTFSTPTERYFLRRGRGGEVVDEALGKAFGGILVSDFYVAYHHYPGLKQRCWAHLLRDIHKLKVLYPEDQDLAKWARGVQRLYTKLDFPHFKRRKRGNRQVGGTERLGVPAYRGRQPTLKNPPTPATGGVAPGQWRPRRSATACRTRPLGAGSWGAVFATRGRPGWSRRRFPAGRAWCGRWPGRTTGVGFPRPGGSAPPER